MAFPRRNNMLVKSITYFGVPVVLVCDGHCNKAWGINNRPRVQLSDVEDDYSGLADREVGVAPIDPGTYEGSDAKPTDYRDPKRQNKWCVRECERSVLVDGSGGVVELPDYRGRVFNIPSSRDACQASTEY
jgi:hypothetical protein